MIVIREERQADYSTIRKINDLAFNQPNEGIIIEKIRQSGAETLSLVALIDGKLVGHIFFSPVIIENHPEIKNGMGLAPMSVLPEYQNQGIGSLLVREGIERLKIKSVPFIIVLGHELYYPKFGFQIASKYQIKCQWEDVPDEVFMILILNENLMKNIHGIAKYLDEFNEVI